MAGSASNSAFQITLNSKSGMGTGGSKICRSLPPCPSSKQRATKFPNMLAFFNAAPITDQLTACRPILRSNPSLSKCSATVPGDAAGMQTTRCGHFIQLSMHQSLAAGCSRRARTYRMSGGRLCAFKPWESGKFAFPEAMSISPLPVVCGRGCARNQTPSWAPPRRSRHMA